MEFITSESNSQIKLLKALRDRKRIRHEERLFIVEGPRFVEDALVFATPRLLVLSESRAQHYGGDDAGISTIVVPDSLFAKVSDTTTPQGVLAVFSIPEVPPSIGTPDLIVVADGIQDPGNLGTLIRSAAALGATSVICAKGTVDPWTPKVVRGAASSLFQISIGTGVDLAVELGQVPVRVADTAAPLAIDHVDWTVGCAIVVGGEGSGVVSDLTGLNVQPVSIPQARPVESLNAGVAGSIVLYEASRQRRQSLGQE